MADRILKTCTKCGETKPLDDGFYRDKKHKDGHASHCKECAKARMRRWKADNAEKAREYNRRYTAANRDRKNEYSREWYRANRDYVAEYGARWYAENRDQINARARQHYVDNRDEIAARQRQYYAENQDKIRAYREENREEIRERQQAWREANPHASWRNSYLTRIRKYEIEPVVEDFTKADVIARYGDRCFYCETGKFEHLDHYVSVKAGGPHTLDNVRPSCADCNLAKSDLTADEWLAEQAELDELTPDELDDLIDAEIARWTT